MDLKSEKTKRVLFFITFAVILFLGLNNIGSILGIIGGLVTILSPFLLGIAIAFIFNGPMVSIENILYNEKSPLKNLNGKIQRGLSYFLTFIFFAVVISVILFLVIPELAVAFIELGEKVPGYLENLYDFAVKVFENNPFIINRLEQIDWSGIGGNMVAFLKTHGGNWLGSTYTFASSAVGSIINFGLAFIFSVYVLLSKEKVIRITKKTVLAYLPEKVVYKLLYIGRLSNEAFSGFLNGKIREVFVIIVLFGATMKLLNFPYALTISVLIGVLTLIPWFGVFIGFAIGFFLILAVDVKMALWFLLIFIIIYQVEGNLIYPIVVGKASGLSSIWIFVTSTLGAKIGGIAGLVLSIPIFSVIYTLVAESVKGRLEEKDIENVEELEL